MADETRQKCDGLHGGPRCGDAQCWNDDPAAYSLDELLRIVQVEHEWIAEEIRDRIEASRKAVKYALDRQQSDGDFGYVAGYGTQTFYLFCAAEAAYLGRPLAEIEETRGKQFWRYKPRVVELQERIEALNG